jgi:hypothetical protein
MAVFTSIINVSGMMVEGRPKGLVLCPNILNYWFTCYVITNELHTVKFRIAFCNQPRFS